MDKAEVARWPTGSAEWPVASEAEGSELLRAAGVPPLRRSDDLDSPGGRWGHPRFPGAIKWVDPSASTMIRRPDGVKRPQMGSKRRFFSKIGYVAYNGATPVSEYS